MLLPCRSVCPQADHEEAQAAKDAKGVQQRNDIVFINFFIVRLQLVYDLIVAEAHTIFAAFLGLIAVVGRDNVQHQEQSRYPL